MKAINKVKDVYPDAVCIENMTEGGRKVAKVFSQASGLRAGRKLLGISSRASWAWAEAWRQIEREGIPFECPRCGTALKPFMGEEDGPVTSWAHPKQAGCPWSEYEGLTKLQIRAADQAKGEG